MSEHLLVGELLFLPPACWRGRSRVVLPRSRAWWLQRGVKRPHGTPQERRHHVRPNQACLVQSFLGAVSVGHPGAPQHFSGQVSPPWQVAATHCEFLLGWPKMSPPAMGTGRHSESPGSAIPAVSRNGNRPKMKQHRRALPARGCGTAHEHTTSPVLIVCRATSAQQQQRC